MSDGGKGDERRPMAVPRDEYERRWAKALGDGPAWSPSILPFKEMTADDLDAVFKEAHRKPTP